MFQYILSKTRQIHTNHQKLHGQETPNFVEGVGNQRTIDTSNSSYGTVTDEIVDLIATAAPSMQVYLEGLTRSSHKNFV